MPGIKGQARLPQQPDPRVRRNAAGFATDAQFVFGGALTIVNGVVVLGLGTTPALDQTSGLVVLVKANGGVLKDASGLYVDNTKYVPYTGSTATVDLGTHDLTTTGNVVGGVVEVGGATGAWLSATNGVLTITGKKASGLNNNLIIDLEQTPGGSGFPEVFVTSTTGVERVNVIGVQRPVAYGRGQFTVSAGTTDYQLLFGYDQASGTNGSSWFQSIRQGYAYTPIILQPQGGGCTINTDTVVMSHLSVNTTSAGYGINLKGDGAQGILAVQVATGTARSFISPTYWDTYDTDFSFNTHDAYSLSFVPQGTGNIYFKPAAAFAWTILNNGNLVSYVDGTGTQGIKTAGSITGGLMFPKQASSAPTYAKGALYFDTTLNKLRVGGATTWETVTSI
jgi:hypothetical protein